MSVPSYDGFQVVDPIPETNLYADDLGDAGYEYHASAGMDGYGVQAHVDLPSRGSTTQGLRVTVSRGSLETLASNGVKVSITRINATPASVTYDPDAKTLTGNVQNNTTMAALKALIDNITNDPLETEYYGGETGTSMAEAYLGDQATFDIPTAGYTDRGLRVTVARASLEGEESNGVRTVIAEEAALDVTFTAASKLVEIEAPDGTLMSALKTEIDGTAGLSSVYFGGEDGQGDQATFDLFTRGSTTRGLRVTIARTALSTTASNGVPVELTRVNADAVAFDYDDTDDTISGNVRNATTMGALKALVDANAELSSVYFGGETGTGMAEAQTTESAGGTADPIMPPPPYGGVQPSAGGTADAETAGAYQDFPCWLRFLTEDTMLAVVTSGTAAPTADGGAMLIRNTTGEGHWLFVPEGHRVYVKQRPGSGDSVGSVHRYQIKGYGYPRRF